MMNKEQTRGPGRPPLPDSERKNARVTIRLDDADQAALDVLMNRMGCDQAAAVRRAIRRLAATMGRSA